MLSNAYSRGLPSAQCPMFLSQEATSMILLPTTSYRLLKFTSAYVPFASSIWGRFLGKTDRILKRVCFFHFHRYFIWLYEKALQEECGYKGTQPYWDWTISWQDPRNSTVFDSSQTSLGSNGKLTPHGPTTLTGFGISIKIAPATGGGCVYAGPFKDYTVNLGPVASAPMNGSNGLEFNPRCLSRDLSLAWSNQTKPTDVTSLISSCANLGCFGTTIEALNGVHAAGHFAIGSMAMDAFASASDPAFYLHHAQVDRVWSIWQNFNAQNRTRQVYGTSTAFNGQPDFICSIREGSCVLMERIPSSSAKSERGTEHRY